jgi:hypothetical protein
MSVAVAYSGMAGAMGSPYQAAASGNLSNGSQIYDTTNRQTITEGTLTFSGNYGTSSSHGDPVDFSLNNLVPPGSLPQGTNMGQYPPTRVEIYEAPQSGTAATGYAFVYCPGPATATPDGCTQAGGVVCILGTGAASGQGGTELTGGSAYSGFTPSLNGVSVRFRAWFARN